jgi:hypothetical protein
MLHLMMIQVTQGGLESRQVYQIVNTLEELSRAYESSSNETITSTNQRSSNIELRIPKIRKVIKYKLIILRLYIKALHRKMISQTKNATKRFLYTCHAERRTPTAEVMDFLKSLTTPKGIHK